MNATRARFGGRRAAVPLLAIGTVALVILLDPAPGWAASTGCVSFQVDAPVRLPDGTLLPPGTLRLCDWKTYSPVSNLHRTYMDGRAVGLLRSKKTMSEGGSDISPIVFFSRGDEGQLELYGYVLPARDRSVTFLFGNKQPTSPHLRHTVASSPPQPERLIAVAALPE